ncbi:hypothetical protein [Ruegeria sp. SCP11]|uniref:hypothetical protein n=1 Tax=Ruegeria sp. SCP11 TaxID=3141378 RepID=UPI003336A231
MKNRIRFFTENEDGAVTVDWVVLTAAIAFMGGVVAIYIAEPVKGIDAQSGQTLSGVATQVKNMEIAFEYGDPPS